jgi:hypothetical protein
MKGNAVPLETASQVPTWRARTKGWVPLLVSALLLFAIPSSPARGSEKVDIIFLGEVAPSNQLFLDWLGAEPRFSMTTVPCDLQWVSIEEAKRFARIYLPRTEEDLSSDFDVAIFEDFGPDVLPISFVEWTQDAIYDGMGIALIEFAYWGGTNEIGKWMDMRFYEVFPASVYLNVFPAAAGRTFYDVMNDEGPLNLPGIESIPMNGGYHGDLGPRIGATVEARWRGRKTPAMVTSTYGEGHTLQLDHGWDNIPGDTKVNYEYLSEYIFNHVFYIGGIPYPEDLDLVRITRGSLIAYSDRKKATVAVIEFVETFGADSAGTSERLDELDSRYREASQLYIAGEYQKSSEIVYELLEEFHDLDEDLMKAKDRAFLWIYLAEWLGVIGTSTGCGVLLWSLMVRRKLYRDVGTTRSSR